MPDPVLCDLARLGLLVAFVFALIVVIVAL
jgi:hypothetical protein